MESNHVVFQDYHKHRTIIGYLGLVLIIGVVLFDFVFPTTSSSHINGGDWLRGSISAYYHSAGGVLFVAVLAIIGVALLAYQGFDNDGKYTSVAGGFALGIAIFPTYPDNAIVAENFGLPSTTDFWPEVFDTPLSSVLHGFCAVSFFVVLWYIMRFRFTKSGRPSNNKKYRVLSSIMLASMCLPVLLYMLEKLMDSEAFSNTLDSFKVIFWVEVVGILCFSAAWLTKGRAIIPLIGQLYRDESTSTHEYERYNKCSDKQNNTEHSDDDGEGTDLPKDDGKPG